MVPLSLSAALSLLRSNEEKPPVLQNKFMGDIEELAAGYERKLIEVSASFLFCSFAFFFDQQVFNLVAKQHCIKVVALFVWSRGGQTF